jgi:hypothetical protein
LLRSILQSGSDADIAKAVIYGRRIKVYPLSQAANPPPTTFVKVARPAVSRHESPCRNFFRSNERPMHVCCYRRLKPSSRHPYDVYLRRLESHIGLRQIAARPSLAVHGPCDVAAGSTLPIFLVIDSRSGGRDVSMKSNSMLNRTLTPPFDPMSRYLTWPTVRRVFRVPSGKQI